MSMGDSGLFKSTTGARAAEIDAPIGFDETPPEMETAETHTFSCRDQIPHTIVPAQTNGGRIRSMDNHRLAKWLSAFSHAAKSEDDVFVWLNQLCAGTELDVP